VLPAILTSANLLHLGLVVTGAGTTSNGGHSTLSVTGTNTSQIIIDAVSLDNQSDANTTPFAAGGSQTQRGKMMTLGLQLSFNRRFFHPVVYSEFTWEHHRMHLTSYMLYHLIPVPVLLLYSNNSLFDYHQVLRFRLLGMLSTSSETVNDMPNPDGRCWYCLTVQSFREPL